MTNLKPILILTIMFLSVVMIWQVATMTGFAAGTNETVPSTVILTNQVPVIGNITCGNNNIITPSPCQNTTVNCWAVVNDSNGATDISVTKAILHNQQAVTCSLVTPGENSAVCYQNFNCSYTTIDAYARNYTCNFTFRHFAAVTCFLGSPCPNWTVEFRANDSANSVANLASTLPYVENMTALDINETALGFGSLSLGDTSGEVNSTITNCGNGNIAINVSGSNLPCSVTGTIPVGNLRYNGTFSTAYANDTNLTTSSKRIPLIGLVGGGNSSSLSYRTNETSYTPGVVYWQIQIPPEGVKGLCAGNITFYAIRV